MHIESLTTGPFQENCYLLWNAQREALVVDPGDEAARIAEAIANHALDVLAYVCTHGHADHVNALAELHDATPAPIVIHSADLAWAFEAQNQIAPYYLPPKRPQNAQFLLLEDNEDWHIGPFHFQRIDTPGHSPGSCCLLFPECGILIAGDTLFKGSCGRTDLPGGDPSQLRKSLDKLKLLSDETRVYPGHGPSTTIGIERATNFYMQ